MTIEEAFKSINEAEKAIHDHIGFEEQWHVYPLSDNTEYKWKLIDNGEKVLFIDSENRVYTEDVSGIYKGKDFTGMIIDTRTDGNTFLSIFKNNKYDMNLVYEDE